MLAYPLTNEVELRLLMPYHAHAFAALVATDHEDIGRWFGWATADFSPLDALDYIQNSLRKLAANDGMTLGVFVKGTLAGMVKFNLWHWARRGTEISYWLGREFRGQGIMTRAVEALTHYALTPLELNRVEIIVHPQNAESVAVPMRLGYTRESVREEWYPQGEEMIEMAVYVMLARHWRALHPDHAPIPSLLTHRLGPDAELRLLLPHHAQDYVALVLQDQDDLQQWLYWVKPFDLDKAQDQIRRWLNRLADNDGMTLGIFYRDQFAGWINYHYWHWRQKRTELGYWLGVHFRNLGLTTHSVIALTDYALNDLALNRVEILMDKRNIRSSAVPRRLNFQYEGVRHEYYPLGEDTFADVEVYYMLRRHWKHHH